MREIKLRQWDTDTNNRFGYFFDGKQDFIFDWDCDDPIMQYTGLKDSNGADIYEGDVVKDSFGGVSVVTWCSNSASFYCKYLDDGLGMDEFGSLLEVIGNIYENPELMKVSDEN